MKVDSKLKFVFEDPIDDKSSLVQVMAQRQTGDKPLPEPMITQFTDQLNAALGNNELTVRSIFYAMGPRIKF